MRLKPVQSNFMAMLQDEVALNLPAICFSGTVGGGKDLPRAESHYSGS
jgi:hypothetical protein